MGNEGVTLETLGAGIEKINYQLERVDKRLDGLDGRLDGMDKRFDRVEGRLSKLDTSIDSLQVDMTEVKAKLVCMDAKYDETFGNLDVFLKRPAAQEDEFVFAKNEQNIIKRALKNRLGVDVESPEFR
jgi:chromosome segregation ATPase